jgi:trans-aconitate methyltransferase
MAFEFNGEEYARAATHQMEWGERLMAELVLSGNERILDLGCGDGGLTVKLSTLVPHGEVVGVDSSHGMLDVARRHKRDNLRFELVDINHLCFASEFDLIFSNATLHWVRDHKRLLQNVLDALNDNGIVRFNFAADGNCILFGQAVRDVTASPVYSRFFSEFKWPWYMPMIDEYRGLVATFDFSDFEVWGENADRYFPDQESLARWIDQPSIVPFLEKVDASHKQSFRDEVVSKTASLTRQEDGTYFETFRRVNLRARK